MKNILLLSLMLSSSVLLADAKSYYYQKQLQSNDIQTIIAEQLELKKTKKKSSDLKEVSIEKKSAGTYQQKLNHFVANESRTFAQRYFFDDTFAKDKESPVLLYICGESSCSASKLKGQVREHAQKLGAFMVTLEHRYYGQSQPFDDLSTENLQYLSTDQAIEDLAAFQKWYSEKRQLTGKWVAIGGSYAGNLSAFYRLAYPENVVGALSSSAPVIAKERFEEYDAHVRKVAGEKCSTDMLEVFAQLEGAFGDDNRMRALKQKFRASDIESELDFLYAVIDVSAAAVQYGMKDEFCSAISQTDKLGAYAAFARKLTSRWQTSLFQFSFESAKSLKIPNSGAFGMRAWLYQSCTEYGYWQVAHQDNSKSARSKLINLEFHRDTCKELFDIDVPASVDEFNQAHYQRLLEEGIGNIFYTNGDTDPWSTLSILDQGILSNDSSAVFIIDGAAHCDDLRASRLGDSAELKKSRSTFYKMMRDWLI